MTDGKFIRRILDGDEEAALCFKEIYIDGLVRAAVSKKYPSLRSCIEDIRQGLWAYFTERDWKILRNFKNLPNDPPPGLRSYLYVAISRFIVKQYRDQLIGRFIPLFFDEDDDADPMEKIASPDFGPDRVLENKTSKEKVGNVAGILMNEVLISASPAGLSDRELEILRMRCIMERPSREVADLLGMKAGAVDTALSRAKKKIRDFYEARGLLNDVREVLRDVTES
jgi:RNA polymerase sigma factor (sigma-70 family)